MSLNVAMEAIKNICCVKGQVDHSTVTRLVKEFCSDWKKTLDDLVN